MSENFRGGDFFTHTVDVTSFEALIPILSFSRVINPLLTYLLTYK